MDGLIRRKYPRQGDVFRHFKGKYYTVHVLAHHSETNETLVIYKAMYGRGKVCARPVDMFMSEVDHDKYPDVEQKYRFEFCGNPFIDGE